MHRINSGKQPALREYGDFFWFSADAAVDAAAIVVDIVGRCIPPGDSHATST